MQIKHLYYILFLFLVQFSFSQNETESIGIEIINVVKPYTPSVSDAFKIKEETPIIEEIQIQKIPVSYSIFSFPVASTFTPNKGVAAKVEKTVEEQLFSNYARFGIGNYGTIDGALFATKTFENDNYISANFKHLSSQGGIKNVDLNTQFFNTSLDLIFGYKSKSLSWNTNLFVQNQIYNWYGIDPIVSNAMLLATINPKQNYNTIALGGAVKLSESVLKEASIGITRFFDGYNSAENRVVVQPKFEMDILEEKVKINLSFDYLNGAFRNNSQPINPSEYGFTNIAIQPNFSLLKEDLSLNLGLSLVYSVASDGGKNKFFYYPNVTASYKIFDDNLIGFAGAEGGLIQNSYHDFVQNNNFVSPSLTIIPTDKKFDIYAGVRGKLSNTVGYNAKISLVNEDYKPFFKSNTFNLDASSKQGFEFGNSFQVLYDTTKTISISGEISADVSKNINFSLQGIFSKYILSNLAEPWNLPNLKISGALDFKIIDKWNAGFKLFYVGERKDEFTQVSNSGIFAPQVRSLAGYFDVNMNVNYQYNKRLGFFVNGNNLANQSYQRWMNFTAQGIQVLLGATYKFDF